MAVILTIKFVKKDGTLIDSTTFDPVAVARIDPSEHPADILVVTRSNGSIAPCSSKDVSEVEYLLQTENDYMRWYWTEKRGRWQMSSTGQLQHSAAANRETAE